MTSLLPLGLDVESTKALLPWAAGAFAAIAVVGLIAFWRRQRTPRPESAADSAPAVAWRSLAIPGAVLTAAIAMVAVTILMLFNFFEARNRATARLALDARTAELTLRALAPGSPLACLETIANPTIEAACENALFANPETAAASVAYVDARLTLLADGLAYAASDPGYLPSLERLRRAVENDRFGVVAQVLATRGCTETDCSAFKLMRDTSRIVANLKARTFDANVVLHAAAWRPEGVGSTQDEVATTTSPAPSASRPSHPVPSKYEFPSASSIPPVNIMSAEPVAPNAEPPKSMNETGAKPQPQRRAPAPKEVAPHDSRPANEQAVPPSTPSGTLFNLR